MRSVRTAAITAQTVADDPPEPPRPGRDHLELEIAGVCVARLTLTEAVEVISGQLTGAQQRPLAIGSVNLDHVHHFGTGGQQRAALGQPSSGPEWLMLVDGSPVARHARSATGKPWPRVTGADLLPALLTRAERDGARVGFLGGATDTVPALRDALRRDWPELEVVHHWTPTRRIITDPRASQHLAAEIKRAGVDMLIVGLGKPRQEKWIEHHGAGTGAAVLTAFGAAADFLAGTSRRAPVWMRTAGIEWSYRLLHDPRRLSRRYLIDGPRSMWHLHRAALTLSYPQPNPVSTPAVTVTRSAAAPLTPVASPPVREPLPHS